MSFAQGSYLRKPRLALPCENKEQMPQVPKFSVLRKNRVLKKLSGKSFPRETCGVGMPRGHRCIGDGGVRADSVDSGHQSMN